MKNNFLCSAFVGLISFGNIAVFSQVMLPSMASAQSPSAFGSASLGEMGCQRVSDDRWHRYRVSNQDIPIGFEIFQSTASFGISGNRGIKKSEPAAVACRIAPAGESSPFQSLNLSFGLDPNKSYLIDGSVLVRLNVLVDGKFIGRQTVSRGSIARLAVDVSGARSVALVAECVRAKRTSSGDLCPSLAFLEDTLTRKPSQ